MKIKFLKPFRLYNPIGDDMMMDEGTVETMEKEDYAQWLIDNGFAEEVKESSWWKPKYDEEYFYIGHDGLAHCCIWRNDELDNGRLKLGLVFKTEEAGIRCRDYLKAIATVRQDEGVIGLQGIGEEYEAEDNKYDDFCVYTVAFDLYLRKLVVTDADEYISANAIWFDTEEHAQSSLDNHPDEWKIIVNYDWGRETEYVYKQRYAELNNNRKGANEN